MEFHHSLKKPAFLKESSAKNFPQIHAKITARTIEKFSKECSLKFCFNSKESFAKNFPQNHAEITAKIVIKLSKEYYKLYWPLTSNMKKTLNIDFVREQLPAL